MLCQKHHLEDLVAKMADFEPGEDYGYSNTNYLLLGEIMDRTLGYSHHDYITSEILAPLALNDTHNLSSEVDLDDVMSGYVIGYGPDMKAEEEKILDFLECDGKFFQENEYIDYKCFK